MQSSRGGSSIVFKIEVYLPKHFAYSHEACRENPAADVSLIRKHLITFTDSNQKDMLQSQLHSKGLLAGNSMRSSYHTVRSSPATVKINAF